MIALHKRIWHVLMVYPWSFTLWYWLLTMCFHPSPSRKDHRREPQSPEIRRRCHHCSGPLQAHVCRVFLRVPSPGTICRAWHEANRGCRCYQGKKPLEIELNVEREKRNSPLGSIWNFERYVSNNLQAHLEKILLW